MFHDESVNWIVRLSDDERTRKTSVPVLPVHPDMIEHELNTGKVRLVVRDELEIKVNGSLDRLERAVKWIKLGLWLLGALIGSVVAFDHWIGSLAKKSELEELSKQVEAMGEKMKAVGTSLDSLKEHLNKKQPAKWGE